MLKAIGGSSAAPPPAAAGGSLATGASSLSFMATAILSSISSSQSPSLVLKDFFPSLADRNPWGKRISATWGTYIPDDLVLDKNLLAESLMKEQRGSSPHLNHREDRLNPKQETRSPNFYENACESILSFATSKWRTSDSSLVSFENINLRLAPLQIELEEQMLLSLFGFVRTATLSFRSRIPGHSYSDLQTLDNIVNFQVKSSMENKGLHQLKSLKVSNLLEKHGSSDLLPSVVPIGAPWQQIFLLARKQKKIYIEVLDLTPIKLTLSFSSAPWMIRDAAHSEAVSLILVNNTVVQRGLMALVDVEGAPVYLRQLTIAHYLASWDSIKEILICHYTRQLIHEMYKVFGSAEVIGNPMGFSRNVGLRIKYFLFVPARGVLQSPSGLITGVALGTKILVRNTIYAISNAATQFSKAAHKGIVAFTFDEQAVAKQEKSLDSHSKELLNEFLEPGYVYPSSSGPYPPNSGVYTPYSGAYAPSGGIYPPPRHYY